MITFPIHTRAKKLEARRLQAGAWFAKGKDSIWVAKKYGVSTVAAWKWHRAWEADKESGLKSKGRCGQKRQVTEAMLRKVDRALLRGPEQNGFPSPLWTLERVAAVIEKETKTRYHPGHVWKVLKLLGWSNQRPVGRARERNEAEIRRWRKTVWPALQKRGSTQRRPSPSSTKAVSPTAP